MVKECLEEELGVKLGDFWWEVVTRLSVWLEQRSHTKNSVPLNSLGMC